MSKKFVLAGICR